MKEICRKPMPGRRISVPGGFTLVEILVAVMILAIGILAVSQMTVMGMRTDRVISKQMYGRTTLSRHFERLQGLPVGHAELSYVGSAGLDDTVTADHQVTEVTSGGGYTVFWNIADNVPDARFKTVRVIVTWPRCTTPLVSDFVKRI